MTKEDQPSDTNEASSGVAVLDRAVRRERE